MNFLAPFKTRNFENARERCVQRSRPDAKRRAVVALGALLFAISAQDLSAQVGDNNPGGHSGIFNGQINTGCSYDPYTGNATRSITDIAVAGAVGEYPLALVRTANSRAPTTTEVFGFAAGWNHNYNWILEESEHGQTQNFHPTSYTVEFPDGRVETFKQVNWDTSRYRVRASNGNGDSSAGVRERFLPLNLSTLFAYLVLPDGGTIEFKAVQYTNGNGRWWYKYHATAIYDPYGLKTQLFSSTTPNGVWRRLDWVIEPAGRSLHFLYTGTNSPRIASVTASDGRTVNYYYVYCNGCRLDRVSYYSNPYWTASYQYTGSNIGQNLPPLLRTCDDPMYPGPMRRIAYEYKPATPNNPDGTTPVYGQILKEKYWDGVIGHETSGQSVSELTVGESPHVTWKRKEIRGDGAIRTFVYSSGGQVVWASDFMGHQSTQIYDSTTKYTSAIINFNRIQTDYITNVLTGNVEVVTYPFTQGDTLNQTQRPTLRYQYGWANCPDPNNRDANNPYYLYKITDEGGHATIFTRDINKRVTRIDYPDGGYETFAYNGYGQVLTHRMTTGGTETFAYDASYRLQYYSDPYHSNPNNPSIHYFYEGHGWVNGIFDALGHPTNFEYNNRGQLTKTTLPPDPFDNNNRNFISNYYNPDGTMYARTNEIYQTSSYTYDDYRRLTSVTTPVRGYNDTNTNTTSFTYYVNGFWDDYSHTDSTVTWVRLPSSKLINTVYDDNGRKTSVIVAPNTLDEATTSYGYDSAGNLTSVANPLNRNNVITVYDERNRPGSIAVGGHSTTIVYDTAGRQKTITRPNGQLITNVSFDPMNRVLLKSASNVSQGNNYTMATQYEYYGPGEGQPVGLLKTFRDPNLYGTNDKYSYAYDTMGRKLSVTYPLDSSNPPAHRIESFQYDTAGRLWKFTNRANKIQTFTYDALNRMTGFSWNDGTTPSVSFGYDPASRVTSINNANATISRGYFYDNLLRNETETITGGRAKTVSYMYDADGNRASTQYPAPENYIFNYTYTGRNQLKSVNGLATYDYDTRGNLITRTLNANSTSSDYLYDSHDRVTRARNFLSGTTRTVNYGYDDSSNNRLWAKRLSSPTTPESSKGEVFRYDLADQAVIAQLDVLNPDQVQPPPTPQTIVYDPNGNRTWFTNIPYVTDNLSQYTSIGGSSLTYRADANLATYNGSTYNYDAQNRLTGAANMTFKYDGLNRQVSRTVTGQPTTFNVWDGWNLIEEYQAANQGVATAMYLYGARGLIAGTNNGQVIYYYQDGSGSTSHIANSSGVLQEWYRYDLQGAPFFYNANDGQLTATGLGVRHLFTGQQWYQELGLYDLRNRFYSPDVGHFLQPDPIGFRGGNNLYRYCGNNPVTRWDPFGLQNFHQPDGTGGGGTGSITVEPVRVSEVPLPELPDIPDLLLRPPDLSPLERVGSSNPGSGGDGGAGGGRGIGGRGGTTGTGSNSTTQQSIDPLHATTTAEFIAIGNMIEHGDTTDTTPAIDPIDFLSGGIAALVRSSFRSGLQKAVVFWAGGRAAEDAARTFAKASGRTVIADTAAGRALVQSTANIPWSQARTEWVSLSENVSRNASGEVYVFQNARGVPLDSIWRNEYQVLTRNPNVTGINFSVVMPDGSVVPVP